MNSNEDLDRILDHALTEYRDAEPLAGIEDRILRRVAAQPEPSPRRWAWVFAAAVAAAVVMVVVWLGVRERPHQQAVVSKVAATRTTSVAQRRECRYGGLTSGPSRPVAKAHRSLQRPSSVNTPQVATAKPVLKQFPAPMPMTSQEHALLALARTHPDALLASRDDADQINIAPIEIKPLASEAGAPQGEQ